MIAMKTKYTILIEMFLNIIKLFYQKCMFDMFQRYK